MLLMPRDVLLFIQHCASVLGLQALHEANLKRVLALRRLAKSEGCRGGIPNLAS